PDRHQQRVLNGDDGFLGTLTPLEAMIERAVVAAFGSRSRPRYLLKRGPQPHGAFARCDGLTLTCAFVIARTKPRPRSEVCGRAEARHIYSDLGDDYLRGPRSDAGNRLKPVTHLSKRARRFLYACVQLLDLQLEAIDQF